MRQHPNKPFFLRQLTQAFGQIPLDQKKFGEPTGASANVNKTKLSGPIELVLKQMMVNLI
jgi:hypothetical protein